MLLPRRAALSYKKYLGRCYTSQLLYYQGAREVTPPFAH